MTNDARTIEALLFALGRPLSREELAKLSGLNAAAVNAALEALAGREGGIALVDDGREVELRVGSAGAQAVEKARKEEYSRDIGRAGLEALAAILYRGPLSRADIDFIRGVNSSQTLRTLTLRGLVRRIPNPRDERQYLYEPTTELLSQLGVASPKELPEWSGVRDKLKALEEAYRSAQEAQPQ